MLTFSLDAKILPVFVIWFLEANANNKSSLRVIGGRDAAPDEYPYVVRLEVRFHEKQPDEPQGSAHHVHVCTAAAMSSSWTLTAGHCAEGLQEIIWSLQKDKTRDQVKGIIRYRALSGFPTDADSISEILSTHTYPAYKLVNMEGNSQMVSNDVALVRTLPVKLSQYGKLSAADFSTLAGQRAHAVGYGLTSMGSIIMSTMNLGKVLQVLKVIIKGCKDEDFLIQPVMCISGRCGQANSVCAGDSGGPLIHSSGIVAINSKGVVTDCQAKFVKRKITSGVVGLLTPISPFIEWIGDRIRQEETRL